MADHTEIVTGYQGGALFTIGGNSGPSNVDGFSGQGGVHRHQLERARRTRQQRRSWS